MQIQEIPEQMFIQAHAGISFTPEKYGKSDAASYRAHMQGMFDELRQLCGDNPEKLATLEAEFTTFQARYVEKYRALLLSESRCISWMITGPANFPVARNEKRNRVAQKRREELLEFKDRAMTAIRRTLCPELRPIMSGDSDAAERLREKIDEAEKEQAHMKACNAAIRANWKAGADAVVAALVALGCTEAVAREMIQPGRFAGTGFASFSLTNNSANIRRMKQRLVGIERAKAAPVVEKQGTAARLEDCPAENRIRLFFPGKPDVEVRTRLKRSGFRWTPSLGCWQAYRNSGTIATAQKEAA